MYHITIKNIAILNQLSLSGVIKSAVRYSKQNIQNLFWRKITLCLPIYRNSRLNKVQLIYFKLFIIK